MQLSWSLLLVLIAFAAFAVYWHDALGTRDRANDAARETCNSTGGAIRSRTRKNHCDEMFTVRLCSARKK